METSLIGHAETENHHDHIAPPAEKLDLAVPGTHRTESRIVFPQSRAVAHKEYISLPPPPALSPYFVGRDDLVKEIVDYQFVKPSNSKSHRLTVLVGVPGIGKTQIAVKVYSEFTQRHPEGLTFFIDASSRASLENGLQTLIRSHDRRHSNPTAEDALKWLAETRRNWLLILDNADDPALDLRPFIPQGQGSHIIVTSRSPDRLLLAPESRHFVGDLSHDAAILLLLNGSNHEVVRRNIKLAGSIAIELKYNALALDQAAVYVLNQGGLENYLDSFKSQWDMMLVERPLDLPGISDYTLSIYAAIRISFDELSAKTQDLLWLFSFLDRTQISEDIIIDAANNSFLQKSRYLDAVPDQKLEAAKSAVFLMELLCPSGRWSPLDIDRLTSPAIDYSLLEVTTTTDNRRVFSMHSLIQSFLQDALGDRAAHFNRLAARLLVSPVQFRDVGIDQHLLPHIRQFHVSPDMTPFDRLAFAWVLRKGGSSKQAAEHLCEALRMMTSGNVQLDIPFTLRIKQDLAGVYRDMGKFHKAADLGREVMDMWKKLVGEEHPDTIISINNLAVTLSNTRHYGEAANLQRHTLEIQKKVLGAEHRDTLTTMTNLAVTLSYQGKYTEAIDLERKTLEIQRRTLKEDHLDTVKSMNNLGTFLYQQRQYKEAAQLQRRVVELRVKHLGEEHPDTLKAMNNLGTTLCQLGKYSEAASIQRRSVAVQRHLLGEDHLQVLTASHNLAFTLYKNQSYSESLALFEQILKKRQRFLGKGHHDTVSTCRYVAAIYFQQGRNSQAEALLKEFGLRSK